MYKITIKGVGIVEIVVRMTEIMMPTIELFMRERITGTALEMKFTMFPVSRNRANWAILLLYWAPSVMV